MTIAGSNFTAATAVKFISQGGGYESDATSFTVNSDTSITAVSPQINDWGIVDVTVIGPGGTSTKNAQDRFAYGPIVDEMTPQQGPAAGGTSVTLSGFGLEAATAVDFGPSAAASFVDNPDGSITAASPPATAGSSVVRVTVTTPEGISSTYSYPDAEPANLFAYGPTVTNVEPDEGPATGGTSVTIHGTGFKSPLYRCLCGPFVHTVYFGSTKLDCGSPLGPAQIPCAPITFEVESDTEITAIAPPGAGTVDVKVETDGGTSPTSPADLFAYIPSEGTPAPEGGNIVRLVNCKAPKRVAVKPVQRRHRRAGSAVRICTSKLVSGSVNPGSLTARLMRGQVLYATGTATVRHVNTQLALKPLRQIRPGHYKLTLASGRTQQHESIIIR